MPATTIYDLNRAANSTSANLFAGDTNEFTGNRISQINVYAVASAAPGMNITVMADNDVAIQDKVIPFLGTTLIKKDHLLDSFYVGPGSRLSVFLRETAAAATTDTFVSLEIIPM